MRDIPFFTTEYGTASLILREIPYKKLAYVQPVSVLPGFLPALAEECRAFCRAAGAEAVYLSCLGMETLWPVDRTVITMTCPRERLLPGTAALYPVLPENVAHYRAMYNRAMEKVDNAATMERRDEETLLAQGGGYFVHWAGKLLGLGQLAGGELRTVISQGPGGGEAVVRTLAELAQEDVISLQVVSTNARALALYRRLGFIQAGIKSQWCKL